MLDTAHAGERLLKKSEKQKPPSHWLIPQAGFKLNQWGKSHLRVCFASPSVFLPTLLIPLFCF